MAASCNLDTRLPCGLFRTSSAIIIEARLPTEWARLLPHGASRSQGTAGQDRKGRKAAYFAAHVTFCWKRPYRPAPRSGTWRVSICASRSYNTQMLACFDSRSQLQFEASGMTSTPRGQRSMPADGAREVLFRHISTYTRGRLPGNMRNLSTGACCPLSSVPWTLRLT